MYRDKGTPEEKEQGTMNAMQFTNNKGTPFMVRIVRRGQGYGRNFCITHNEDEPLIEFYDARYMHTSYGQFVARYYMNTILDRNQNIGLDLYGGEADWKIDANTMTHITEWMQNEVAGA
jgi:hypothetical protein